MLSFTRLALWLGLSCWYSTAAVAQWNPQMTADLGRGMGQIALSQSVLSATRRIGSGDTTNNTKALAATTQNAGTLTYIPDPRVSEQVRASVVDTLSRQNPTLRAQTETALNGGMVLKIFDRFVSLGTGWLKNLFAAIEIFVVLLPVCAPLYVYWVPLSSSAVRDADGNSRFR
jgi:hypothetical protein